MLSVSFLISDFSGSCFSSFFVSSKGFLSSFFKSSTASLSSFIFAVSISLFSNSSAELFSETSKRPVKIWNSVVRDWTLISKSETVLAVAFCVSSSS